MTRLLYIRSLALAALLLLLLVVAPAAAQNVVFQGDQSTLAVEAEPDYNYKWELYSDGTGNLATQPGNALPSEAVFVGSPNQASVEVRWIEPGVYYYKVTVSDITGCSTNMKIGRMLVKEAKPTATITSPAQMNICTGDTAKIEVALTGKAPWQLSYFDGTKTETITGITTNVHTIRVAPQVSTLFTITRVTDINATNTQESPPVWVFVSPKPVFVRTIHAVDP